MRIKVTGAAQEFKRLHREMRDQYRQKLAAVTDVMVGQLKNVTPVDTGEARDGWQRVPHASYQEIRNDVPHIVALNQGHSQQAPAYFVERILLANGKPVGEIVNVT